jgi:hypothetical protein
VKAAGVLFVGWELRLAEVEGLVARIEGEAKALQAAFPADDQGAGPVGGNELCRVDRVLATLYGRKHQWESDQLAADRPEPAVELRITLTVFG